MVSSTLRKLLALASLAAGVAAQASAITWTFETATLTGWTRTGTAFNFQPTYRNARLPGTVIGYTGNYWIGTFENHPNATSTAAPQGNGPTGILTSDPFAQTASYISFLIGGGNDLTRLRVELLLKLHPGETPPYGLFFGRRFTEPDGDYFVAGISSGRNSETMRRELWDVRGTLYQSRTARIRILDTSTAGHINVDDFQFLGAPPTKTFHVQNAGGTPTFNAEIYINGSFRGRTDSSGNFSLTPPPVTGVPIIARVMMRETRTYRGNHSQGGIGGQNWNYRIYQTSSPIALTGVVQNTIVNSTATQNLIVSPNNTLIGVHWIASFEHDASTSEMTSLRDNVLIPASQRMYNLTDGQFFLEQIDVFDNAAAWDDTDIRIHADDSLRPNVNRRTGGFLGDNLFFGGTWMNMVRGHEGGWGGSYTYDHEFGHYGFDVLDEYQDDHDEVHCTAALSSTEGTYGSASPRASCAMWNNVPKLCSSFSANPHVDGTRQGGTSCWDHLVSRYNESAAAAWNVQTPSMRGGIVGTLSPLPAGWATRITLNNSTQPNLISPWTIHLIFADSGVPATNVDVHLHTTTGRDIYQGKTLGDGSLQLVGLHLNDQISFTGGRSNLIVDSSFGAPTSRPDPIALSTHGPKLQGEQYDTFMVDRSIPNFSLQVFPGPDSTKFVVTTNTALGSKLSAYFYPSGNTKPIPVSMAGAGQTFNGTVSAQTPYAQGVLRLISKDPKGLPLDQSFNVLVTPVEVGQDSDLFSHDGALNLTVPVKAIVKGERISFSDWRGPMALPAVQRIKRGPYLVAASTGATSLSQPAELRFQMEIPLDQKVADSTQYSVWHFNEVSHAWENLGGTYMASVHLVTLKTDQLGLFVLTEKIVF